MLKPIELPERLQREDFDELYRQEKHSRESGLAQPQRISKLTQHYWASLAL